jgi:hypothetical protein
MKLDQSIIDRRQFLDGVIMTGAVGLGVVGAYTALGSLIGVDEPEPDHVIVKGKALEALARERFVLVPYGPAPVILFTLPDGQLRARSVCAHTAGATFATGRSRMTCIVPVTRAGTRPRVLMSRARRRRGRCESSTSSGRTMGHCGSRLSRIQRRRT